MIRKPVCGRGFTLIEMMITLAVLSILLVLAIPSFNDLRQRTALRGAADQVASFWGNARFEALRRNVPVKVGFKSDASGNICLGATTANATTDATCDCFTAGACDVAAYPGDQSEWRGVRVGPTKPTLGNTDTDDEAVAAIDPKRAGLTEAADAGRILLRAPANGSMDYRLDVVIDRNGRAVVCEPTAAPAKLPDYTDRRC